MTTLGWVLILLAVLLIRGIAKGRVAELPGDLRDMLLGALTGDFDGVREAASRTGEGLVPPQAAPGPSGAAGGTAQASGRAAQLVAEVRQLGDGRRYIWGGTFANGGGGDCSGLVWRALKNLGIYDGPRFTTSTFPLISHNFATVVTDPQPGDIAVWQRGTFITGHMGVVTGPDRFYSALSSRSGIKEAKISGIKGRLTYYRLK